MASPFAEAITQSMIAGLDPMNGIVRQYAETSTASAAIELDERKLALIDKINAKLEAITAGEPAHDALRRMLERVSA